MICEKCHNDYPSTYYFATPTICKQCFAQLPEEEQRALSGLSKDYTGMQSLELRVGFGKRFLAAFVDSLIILAILVVFYKYNGFFEAYFELINEFKEAGTDAAAVAAIQNEFFAQNKLNFLIPSILSLVYYLLEIFKGAAVGKMLLNLRIANSNGSEAANSTLLLRYLVKNASSIIAILWVISGSMLLNTVNTVIGLVILLGFFLVLGKNRQDIQDIVARTAVFKNEDLELLKGINTQIQ